MKKNIKILILDLEGSLGVSTAQLLCLAKNIEVHLIVNSCTKNYPGLLSCIQHNRAFSSYDVKFLTILERLCIENSIDLLFPSNGEAIAFAIEYKNEISAFSVLPALPTMDSFQIANNKHLLSVILNENKIQQPITLLVHSKQFVEKISTQKFPAVIKPIVDCSGGDGIKYFSSEDEMRSELPNILESSQKMILQQFIKSTDICISVFCENGEILRYTIQQPLINDLTKYAPALSVEFVDNKEVLSAATKLMKSLNWNGVAHIDMIKEETTNEIFVIEINPRIWGSILSSYFAGVNFPELMCRYAFGSIVANEGYKKIQHVRLEYLKKIFQGKLNLNNSIKILRLRSGFFLQIKYLLNEIHHRYKKLFL